MQYDDQFVARVSRASWLDAEVRRRMSERNRFAAADKSVKDTAQPADPQSEEETRAVRLARERAEAEERMRRSEQNRYHAVVGDPEPRRVAYLEPDDKDDAPIPLDLGEYGEPDEYDTESPHGTHAAVVAQRLLSKDPEYRRRSRFLSPRLFTFGSNALQPCEDVLPEYEEYAYEEPQGAAAQTASAAAMRSSRAYPNDAPRKVRGGRYSDSRSGGYQRRITTSGAIVIGLLTVALISCVIYGKVQTNEIYTEIAELNAVYDDITARNVSMKSEMEGKMTVRNIEDYAENVLGLRQLDQSQIEYVQIQTEDKVTITEPAENFFVTINDFLNACWEFLRGA